MRYRVTTLSVIVVALVFGSGILGYVLGTRTASLPEVSGVTKQQSEPISPITASESSLIVTQSSPSASLSPAELVTNQFYSWYIDCMKVNGGCDYKTRNEIDAPILLAKIK